MTSKLFATLTVAVCAGLIILWSCQKTGRYSKNPDTNVSIVPLDTARLVAERFNPNLFFNTANPDNHSPYALTLHGGNSIKNEFTINDAHGNPAMYVFNFTGDQGYLFVSADYGMQPVLAYFERGEYKKAAAPAGLLKWVNTTMHHIDLVRTGQYNNAQNGKTGWAHFGLHNSGGAAMVTPGLITDKAAPPPPPNPCTSNPNYSSYTETTVGPLLPVTWGQDCGYNDDCPNLTCNDCSANAVTGCVATAMAQLIRYWSPTNSYNYNYAGMPTNTGSAEISRLMHDAGTNVGMSYGCASNGGSSASGGNVPGALTGHFGFTSATYAGYGDASYSTVESNLSYKWPVLLDGCNSESSYWVFWYQYSDCHEWVCDGYEDITDTFCYNGTEEIEGYLYFHMNWGWHEEGTTNDFNGWFAFDDWTISGAGSNGGNLDFQYSNDMTVNIHP
jgi:hypothetical protein